MSKIEARETPKNGPSFAREMHLPAAWRSWKALFRRFHRSQLVFANLSFGRYAARFLEG